MKLLITIRILTVLLCCSPFYLIIPLYAQQTPAITVKGRVTNQNGEPLPGAVIALVGSSKGSVTQSDGTFQVTVPPNSTLRITYIGYLPQETQIGSSAPANLTIQLLSNKSDLNEVIVVGYGKQKKSDITGAITSINEQALKDVPVTNISQALQGQGPGIDVQKSGGNNKPGTAPKILIRGSRSVNASNDPLFVVDGIPYNGNINDLNTDDVVSIEVLKDASSTAIYGSRGANGVILVTTRRGRTGKPVITYSGYGGFVKARGSYPIMDGPTFASFKKWAKVIGSPGKYTGIDDPKFLSVDDGAFTPTEIASMKAGRSYDWQKLIYKTGLTTNHQIGVTGGTDLTQYALSGGYFRETGIYPGQAFERYTVKASVDQQLGKRFKIGLNSLNNYSTTKGESANPMGQALRANPLSGPYDTTGKLVGFIPGNANQVWNPLANFEPGAVEETRRRFGTFTTLYVDINLADGLKYRFNGGAEIKSDFYGNFYGSNTTNNLGGPSSSQQQTRLTTNYTLENLLTYDKTFGRHKLNFTGLYSLQQSQYQDNSYNNSNIAADYLQYYAAQFANNLTGTGTYQKWDIISYMARINYGFDNRYLLTLTMRSDGSSRLAPGNKYHVFPSAAAAWNISQEPFLKNSRNITNLKLRASYGTVGNTAIDPYQTLGLLTAINYNYGSSNVTGAYQTNVPNPALTWEYTSTANIGLDFGLYDNRISGSVEVYKQFTRSLLLPQTLPPTSGIPNSILTNIGKTENKGLELHIATVNIQGKTSRDFSWTTDVNVFMNRGKITQLANGVQQDIANSWFVGKPIGSTFDYRRVGIWQNTAEDTATARSMGLTVTGSGSVIGTIRVADINGDKKIDAKDREVLGSNQPDWQGGMTNRFSFRGFDLTIVAFARMGGQLVSRLYQSGSFINTFQANYNNVDVHYWTPLNHENYYPKPNAGATNTPYVSLLSYYDASYIKIRSMSLGYNLPASLLKRTGASAVRIYATAEEPFILFSPYRNRYGGLDPESAGQLAVDTPPTWSMIFGINITL
ncbi:TonB-dependent receptor [Chitinophaga agrisoli]|uniref:TonB-dependent receptor n=1 Tax=Chitinophaga agrisoli TaxID=2607653 RepID=A0A5B2W047_9BACT|nr:TonB-dependent receptor [Chitinophaga agrisoli]KAA2245423.1 TonB-dependent receptor [Chitinophaga agrisoli]